jgi:hypothetical protein
MDWSVTASTIVFPYWVCLVVCCFALRGGWDWEPLTEYAPY